MRFSLFYNFDVLPQTDVSTLLRQVETQVVLADALGFDGVWLAEHHFQEYGKMPAPLSFLARLSGLTERLLLGTAVIEAPYYHPLRLAEEVALLDLLSGGRVRLGIGSGAGNKPQEFERFGIALEEKGPRQIEVAEILLQALSGQPVEFSGQFHQYHGVQVEPQPVQPVRNLLVMAAGSTATPFAAAHDLQLLLPRAAPDARIHDLVDTYRGGLPHGGPGRVAPLRFTFVAETEAAAKEATRAAFARYAKYDANVEWDGRTDSAEYDAVRKQIKFVAGTPEQVTAQLKEWIDDLDAVEVLCQTFAAGIDHEDAMRSMQLLATEVLPGLRRDAVGCGSGAVQAEIR